MESNAALERLARFYAFVRTALGVIALGVALRYGIRVWADIEPRTSVELVMGLIIWSLLAIPLILGWHARFAALILSVVAFFIVVLGNNNAHVYLTLLLFSLVALSDCERYYALRPRAGTLDTWPRNLMRFQASVVYLVAGLQKANPEFLSGDVLNYSFELAVGPAGPVSALLHDSFLVQPMAFAVVALEVSIALLLWLRPLRPLALGLILPLHTGMLLVPYDWSEVMGVVLFAALMMLLLTAHIDLSRRLTVKVAADSAFALRWAPLLQRLDFLRALRFAEEPAVGGTALRVLVEPEGRELKGVAALQAILESLPAGIFLAPYLSLPPLRRLVDHALAFTREDEAELAVVA